MIRQRTLTACWCALFAIAVVASSGCSGKGDSDGATANIDSPAGGQPGSDSMPKTNLAVQSGDSPFTAAQQVHTPVNPTVLIKTSLGDITVKLNAEKAPITVDNFLQNYAERGFYDNTIVHYVQPGSMVVAGGYDTQYQLKTADLRAEIQSEADNGLSNKRGTLAMARDADYQHSATSQFFFNLKDNPEFDHQNRESAQTYGYCVFGTVTKGLDVLEKIAASPTKEQPDVSPALPAEPVVIQSVTVVE